jgi:hypothetical protein
LRTNHLRFKKSHFSQITKPRKWGIGEKSGALVWRGDFVAAPMLAFARGVDRIVYGSILLQEVKKVVRCFQDDLKAKPLR